MVGGWLTSLRLLQLKRDYYYNIFFEISWDPGIFLRSWRSRFETHLESFRLTTSGPKCVKSAQLVHPLRSILALFSLIWYLWFLPHQCLSPSFYLGSRWSYRMIYIHAMLIKHTTLPPTPCWWLGTLLHMFHLLKIGLESEKVVQIVLFLFRRVGS